MRRPKDRVDHSETKPLEIHGAERPSSGRPQCSNAQMENGNSAKEGMRSGARVSQAQYEECRLTRLLDLEQPYPSFSSPSFL